MGPAGDVETEFIEHLRQRLPPHSALRLGIGDDAAVVACGGEEIVTAADMLVQGRHFRLDEATFEQVGRKALAVNLSDLAAMAARPIAAVVSLALPEHDALESAKRLFEGMIPLAEQFSVAIAGGDTNVWPGPLAINVAVFGAPPARGVWRRDGAHVGDVLLATGEFGGSILGRHLDFTPLVAEAAEIARGFHVQAAMDVSDGLLLDLHRLATASGCGAAVDLGAVPIAPAAKQLAAREGGSSAPLDHALSDGEDFQLLFALAPEEAERLLVHPPAGLRLTRLGEFVERPGLFAKEGNSLRSLAPRGYVHGRAAPA